MQNSLSSKINESEVVAELIFSAHAAELQHVQDVITNAALQAGLPQTRVQHLELVVEEVFINICSYAYKDASGNVFVRIVDDPAWFRVTFSDEGPPFDPLARETPDLTAGIETREVGGLGIFLTKQLMSDVSYKRESGRNMLCLGLLKR